METFMEDEKLVTEVDGVEKEFDVLFTFDSEDTGKVYLGYTDHSLNEEGKKNIFVSSYDPLFGMNKLEPIDTPEEKAMLDDVLAQIAQEATQ